MGCPCKKPLGSLRRSRRQPKRASLKGMGCWEWYVNAKGQQIEICNQAYCCNTGEYCTTWAESQGYVPECCAAATTQLTINTATGVATIDLPTDGSDNANENYSTAASVPVPIATLAAISQTIVAGPTTDEAVDGINTVSPQYPALQTVPSPTVSGSCGVTSSSTLSGFNQRSVRVAVAHALGTLELGDLGACTTQDVSVAKDVIADASLGAEVGSYFGPVGSFIGGLIGGVVGLIEGLFGAKQAVPRVSAADVTQAQQWYAAYESICNTTVGRTLTASAIQDIITAEAILNPGFWGYTSSESIPIAAVNNFYNEVMTRVNDFMTAVAASRAGGTITIHDDSSIVGHAGSAYHPNITYTFISPGINAPSYVLGPLFAQYFFTMCHIFNSSANCSGHLNPPMPQFYTDLIDYVRASHAGWDTPQPNVVGIVSSTSAPTEVGCGCYRETCAVVPVTIPSCEEAAATAKPGSGVAPIIVKPCTVDLCVCQIKPVCIQAGTIFANSCTRSLQCGANMSLLNMVVAGNIYTTTDGWGGSTACDWAGVGNGAVSEQSFTNVALYTTFDGDGTNSGTATYIGLSLDGQIHPWQSGWNSNLIAFVEHADVGHYYIMIGTKQVWLGPAPVAGDTYGIVANNGTLSFQLNGATVYQTQINPSAPLYPTLSSFYSGASIYLELPGMDVTFCTLPTTCGKVVSTCANAIATGQTTVCGTPLCTPPTKAQLALSQNDWLWIGAAAIGLAFLAHKSKKR